MTCLPDHRKVQERLGSWVLPYVVLRSARANRLGAQEKDAVLSTYRNERLIFSESSELYGIMIVSYFRVFLWELLAASGRPSRQGFRGSEYCTVSTK